MTPLRFLSAFLLLIAVGLTTPVFAQTAASDPVKADKLRQLMQAIQITTLNKTMVESLIPQMNAQITKKWPDPAHQEKARNIFREEMALMSKEVLQAAMDLMAPHYTVAELDQLLAFYNSPLGQKSVQVNLKLTQDFGPLVTKYGTATTARLQKRWDTEVK